MSGPDASVTRSVARQIAVADYASVAQRRQVPRRSRAACARAMLQQQTPPGLQVPARAACQWPAGRRSPARQRPARSRGSWTGPAVPDPPARHRAGCSRWHRKRFVAAAPRTSCPRRSSMFDSCSRSRLMAAMASAAGRPVRGNDLPVRPLDRPAPRRWPASRCRGPRRRRGVITQLRQAAVRPAVRFRAVAPAQPARPPAAATRTRECR